MLGASLPTSPLRLTGVMGYEGRSNDLVYCGPTQRTTAATTTVVYFGGDMQDFTENMQMHRDSRNYLKWNLDDTARLLRNSFPEAHVVVVRPARIEYKTFSCFKNFVPCNNCGSPEHTPMHFALQHLEKLLRAVSTRLATMTSSEMKAALELSKSSHVSGDEAPENDDAGFLDASASAEQRHDDLHLDKNKLILIGFSKGCVVLNQFLYEFHYLKTLTPDDQSSMDVVSRICDMYWLDGGHSGGINIHIHVTPYQIQDDRRPCIRKEEKLFGDLLRRLGASITRTVHFENMFPNLYMHFDLINVFRLSDAQPTTSSKNATT